MRICVDGNIAAGKSTVLEAIQSMLPEMPIYPEPVHDWEQLLKLYYEDMATWSLALNLRILMSFMEIDTSNDPHAVIERSPVSCRHVFAQVSYNDGVFDAHQWEVFKGYYEAIGWKPDAVVFLDTPAATCLERVGERQRGSEVAPSSTLDFEYLKKLEFQYANMLKLLEKEGVPVIIIDGTQSKEKVQSDTVSAIAKLLLSQSKG